MTDKAVITPEQIEAYYQKIKKEAEAGGYNLHPDPEIAKALVNGILVNQQRYGYGSCPCRLASGNAEEDRDIVCPCDYRDPDLNEYDACF
jgi:ferredoxin-thioredoxin reductase catalytic subunit